MDFSVLLLALIQGILEWFPVSSSGHIAILENFLGINKGLDLEIALHFGTLMAVFVYFRKDIVNIVRDLLHSKWKTANSKLGLLIIIASIPAALIGFLFSSYLKSSSFLLLGFGWIVTSTALFVGSISKNRIKEVSSISYSKAFFIGVAQVLALIPGVSRSGMTISSGLFYGLNEKDSIKFSYLLSIPIIIGANIFAFGNKTIPFEFLFPTLLCFIVGLIFMHFSFNYVLNKRKNLRFFGIYTLILGIICLYFAFQ